MSSRARLKDVAARAGVSVKTVSNVVNGYEHVTPGTRKKVEEALGELGYVPNLAARGLRNGRSGGLALALPELHAPYFAEIAHHVVRAAAERGWTVLVDETEGRLDRERQVAAGIRAHLIDGLILSPLALTAADLDRRAEGVPMVLLGERVRHDVADRVAVDNVRAARDATAHLLDLGRRRIAAIGGSDPRQESVPGCGCRATAGLCGRTSCRSTRHWRCRHRSGTGRTAPRRCGRYWPPATHRTGCSASTTCSASVRCGRCTKRACGCRRTWPWSASTTSRRPATARRHSAPCHRRRTGSRPPRSSS